MRKNIFDLFLEKIFNVPLWVKQVLYLKLVKEMQENNCEDFLRGRKSDLFSIYVPVITFKGRTELLERKCGFDNNIYNFLQCCEQGYSMLEISINTFLSMEEVAKYYELCLEQNFIKSNNSPEIRAMAGYISGKFRIGEYFKQKSIINVDQLQRAIQKYEDLGDKKFGEILVELGFVKQKDLTMVLKLKEEAQKRFILDYNALPKSETEYSNKDREYEEEIANLKDENTRLKQKMVQLLELVKKNAKQ